MLLRRHLIKLSAAAVVASALALSACGGVDGIEMNGKLFDLMGISPASQEGRTRDARMADRAPLVVPPNTNRLPEPGSGKVTSADVVALNDPELRKQAAAKERERLHLAYCRGEVQWKDQVVKQQDDTTNRSPYGPCPGLFSGSLNNLNK